MWPDATGREYQGVRQDPPVLRGGVSDIRGDGGARARADMRADYSWTRPGQEYLDIYQHIRRK
jgi:hypothetical protein